MSSTPAELFRIDPLTGHKNYLGFLEYLASLPPATDLPPEFSHSEPQTIWVNDASLLFVEINHMKLVNESHGHLYGDSVINWLGIVLAEESDSMVFRVGGVEFVVVINSGTSAEREEILHRILARVSKEGAAIGMADPVVHIAFIHYECGAYASPTNVLMQMTEAMLKIKNAPQNPYQIFTKDDLKASTLILKNWVSTGENDVSNQSRWIARRNVQQTLWMSKKLDQVQEEAFTDAISGLPNMKAALLNLEKTLQDSVVHHKSFSLLLIDGDNIRIYNSINYAAGDAMIRDLCAVFKSNLRPNDFVARWRSGDEFVVILPDTSCESAKVIGERFRLAVKEASRTWKFPVTISIGIACYPSHGEDIDSLIDKAEIANKHAKDQGKDRVVLAD